MRTLRFLLSCLIVSLICSVGSSQPSIADTQTNSDPANEEHELRKAQIEYYRSQTEKVGNRSVQEALKNNLAGLAAASGALIAALIALISLVVNRRITIRNQKDMQFYETLKRFGDQDSAMLRTSAAGLLAQIGRERSPLLRKKLYFKTAADQLLTALLVEKEAVVRTSVANGITNLSVLDRKWVAQRLLEIDRTLRNGLYEKILEWALEKKITNVEEFTDKTMEQLDLISETAASACKFWFVSDSSSQEKRKQLDKRFSRLAARSNAFDKDDRCSITSEIAEKAVRVKEVAWLTARVLSGDRTSPFHKSLRRLTGWSWSPQIDLGLLWLPQAYLKESTLVNLALRSSNMTEANLEDGRLINVDFSEAQLQNVNISQSKLNRTYFSKANLKEANLAYCRLTNVDFKEAQLQNANISQSTWNRVDFSNADLRGAILNGAKLRNVRLAQAQIDDRTDFAFCNWWSADFYSFKRNSLAIRYGRRLKNKLLFRPSSTYDSKFVDELLLEKLFSQYSAEYKERKKRSRVHSSVRQFEKNKKDRTARFVAI